MALVRQYRGVRGNGSPQRTARSFLQNSLSQSELNSIFYSLRATQITMPCRAKLIPPLSLTQALLLKCSFCQKKMFLFAVGG